MHKRMKVMLLIMTALFGGIFIYKAIMSIIIKKFMASQSQVISVSTMKAEKASWDKILTATANIRAIRGVNVTTELAGMVKHIYFTPGTFAHKDDVLVQLKADSDIAHLHALQANAELAATTLKRDQAQYAIRAVSKQTVDIDAANLKNLQAQVDQQAAIVAKKTIRAPFTGHLGINKINPGQYLNPGDAVVSLQTLDPVYADFYIPQQYLSQIKMNLSVFINSNAWPEKSFQGKITSINPAFDTSTRNIEVEATIANPDKLLRPGMFAQVKIITGEPSSFLTVPQTAVSFNPYGSIIYIVKEKDKQKTVTQHFVVTGKNRGEQIQILKGLQAGDEIVTSGQLKLKNGSRIAVNNRIAPANNPAPVLKNDH